MAANKQYPYTKGDITIYSKLDELMYQFYQVDGQLHREAFQIGQELQYYFAVHVVAVVNQSLEGRKIGLPDMSQVIKGLECPFTLMIDNSFFQDNYQALIPAILQEITRMHTSREMKDEAMMYALNLSKWEYLSIIALLVGGTKAQRSMDIAMRSFTAGEMTNAMKVMAQGMKDG